MSLMPAYGRLCHFIGALRRIYDKKTYICIYKQVKTTMDNNKDNEIISIGRGCEFYTDPETGEREAVSLDGCHKLHTYDWTSSLERGQNKIYEVRFKNTRKGFYENVNDLPLKKGDIVAVESSPGHDIGIISLTGDMVAKQMRCVGFDPDKFEFKKIYRKAKPYDIEKWQEAIGLEHDTMIRSRQIATSLGLDMKIGDVEYQGDKIKAIFYYIADARIDFRTLIKLLADEFKIRVEMKQIGARQEAGRIGGIGACGRELCCSTWVTNFVSVTTNSARYQDILLNPQKLAGQCGKLKCCLNFEVDSYIDARKAFPKLHYPLETQDASYTCMKTDILKKEMTFSSDPHSMSNTVTISVDRVKEVMSMNKRGQKPAHLGNDIEIAEEVVAPDYRNVIGDDSITRFDKKEEEKGRRKRNRNKQKRNGEQRAENGEKRQSRDNENTEKPQQEQKERSENKERPEAKERQPRPNRPGGRNSQRRGNNGQRPENAVNSEPKKENGAPKTNEQNKKTSRGLKPKDRRIKEKEPNPTKE